MEDRQTKAQRDEMERQVREARGSAPADGPARVRIARPPLAEVDMPGEGSMLSSPPPYEAPAEEPNQQ